jgi:hypothetical protein
MNNIGLRAGAVGSYFLALPSLSCLRAAPVGRQHSSDVQVHANFISSLENKQQLRNYQSSFQL